MINLNNHKANYHSQYGEDGILEELLTYVDRTGFVIEFGAADGTFCSNTAHQWRDLGGCHALLIESDANLYAQLEQNTQSYSGVTRRNALVHNIDEFTDRVADICSIDVDGADYQIAQRMEIPHQIVLVEHNPTVPPHVSMIGVEDRMYGSSAKSIVHMMKTKNYTLVAATKTNLIFLYGSHYDTFETRLEVLFDYSALNYVVTSYQGEYDFIGEFGYGFDHPVDLRLDGEGKRHTVDGVTLEYMRQMVKLQENKENV